MEAAFVLLFMGATFRGPYCSAGLRDLRQRLTSRWGSHRKGSNEVRRAWSLLRKITATPGFITICSGWALREPPPGGRHRERSWW